MIVADGMGGHKDGELASALAVAAILDHLAASSKLPDDDAGEALRQAMLAAMDAAQDRVFAACSGPHSEAMGCTLILACVLSDTLYTCHVGDVCAYLWSGQVLRTLTRDHSLVAELIALGELTADQARVHPAKNQVLQAIGMRAEFDPDINICELKSGDRVLLCSDGLWEMLAEQEFADLVGGDGSMRQILTQLIDRANDAGGNDNTTAVLYEHLAH